MFIAILGGIFKFKDLPEEYGPYVQFKAAIEGRDEIDERELREADAKVNVTTLKILEGHLWVHCL